MTKQIIAVFAGVLLFASCKKNDKCNTDVASVSGTYKVASAKYKEPSSGVEVDAIGILFGEACEKDDLTVLNSNGTYQNTDAGVVCDPSNTYSGDWSLSGNTLILDGDSYTIESFNCTTLSVSATGYFTTGDKMTINLQKQ